MKILLVNDYGTPTGGAEINILMLRDTLRNRGHDARLFASSARNGNVENLADYKCLGTTSGFRTLLQTANPWAFLQLRRLLAEFRPDVVHVSMFLTQLSPLILPLLKDLPSLYHVVWYRPVCPLGTKLLPDGVTCEFPWGTACYHNNCLPLRDWFPLMLQMKLWRQWSKVFNLVIANSEAVKRQLVAEGIEPVEVLWHGTPMQSLRPPLSEPPTVAFAGRLVREKGIDVLLNAFANVVKQIPSARLLIAGDGPERERLNSLARSLELLPHVTMLGHLSQADLEPLFDRAWAQAVPSLWAEPFGLVAIEAMMRGTAVIASSTGGLTEIIQDGKTGFLIPPGNVDLLTEALLKLLCNRELAEKMGRAGHDVAVAQFSEATFVDKIIHLYESIC
ncbi:MAG: glycosyltransferase family 4 protein [Thermodesulfobacteriota bacterium]